MAEPAAKIYVIRNLSFWYDDEYYSTLFDGSSHVGHLSAIFHDQATALAAWKQLEFEFSQRVNFSNVLAYDESYSRLDAALCDADVLAKLSVDELFQVIADTDRYVYCLYEYPADLQQYIPWSEAEQAYAICNVTTDVDDRPNIFLEAHFFAGDDRLAQISPPLGDRVLSQELVHLSGTAAELSDAPQLLIQLIEQSPYLSYDAGGTLLTVKLDAETINSLNGLLKQPYFKIRCLSIPEIYEIEQSLNKRL